jgi:hypothetical protein
MATSIFEVNAVLGGAGQAPAAQPQTTTTAATPTVQQPTKTDRTPDTVQISEGAQVRLLKNQGQTVEQIAVTTALSTQTVDSYLGITQPAAPAVAASNK